MQLLAPVLYLYNIVASFALCRSSSSVLSWSLSRWERVIKYFLWDAIFLRSTSFSQFNTNNALSSPKRDKNNKQWYSHLLIYTRFQTQTYGKRSNVMVVVEYVYFTLPTHTSIYDLLQIVTFLSPDLEFPPCRHDFTTMWVNK